MGKIASGSDNIRVMLCRSLNTSELLVVMMVILMMRWCLLPVVSDAGRWWEVRRVGWGFVVPSI
jgi:cadmium resistance protein CadD (predicted permease)